MSKITLLFTILFQFCYLIGFSQEETLPYKIFDQRQKKEITLKELTTQIPSSSVLLFGEEHNDSIGHMLEFKIMDQLLAQYGEQLVLSLEMFERDVQSVLNEYLAGVISEKNFIKESRAWGNYADYKPMVELAKKYNIKMIAANAPARYTNRVTRLGLTSLKELDKDTKKLFAPLPVDTLKGIYAEKFTEILGGHSMPDMHLYQSQNFWDATMANSIAGAFKKNKKGVVLHLNGRFHSDYFTGLTERLKNDYKLSVRTISCFKLENHTAIDWKVYEGLADFVIITQ